MKASDLRLDELVQFYEGNLSLKNRRLVLHDIHAFAQFRKDMLDMVGPDNARRILTRFGFYWGQADAAAMKRVFVWETLREWIKAGPRLQTLQGVARAGIKSLSVDDAGGHFSMEVVWHNSGEAAEHLDAIGPSREPVCWMLAGYLSGYATFCCGHNIYFVEQQCSAQGLPACIAVGKDQESWGAALNRHLPYFKAEDIKGRILSLTAELKRTTRELEEQRRKLEAITQDSAPEFLEVHSASFRKTIDLATRVARFDSEVLVTGETGVGKEVLARYVHRQSRRAAGPFIAINCGAVPESLLESELFGHKAGAFTGATGDREGLFEQAVGGTLFLDEIGEITPAIQVKLLRVLQDMELRRVGENRSRKINARVIAATNRDLPKAIRQGVFRQDLFYRLGVVELRVPPLRERRDDILPLARHFAAHFARRFDIPRLRLDATCLPALLNYPWPGNVRELENAVEHAAVMSHEGLIMPDHLPAAITRPGDAGAPVLADTTRSLADVERAYINAVLQSVNGNRTRAAAILGIGQTTLWRKLKA
ncbi:sigma 54-interacting transcriptional regulator [bacterium]|nr:sigma 54-interacting transcriptional regulator [bacterium]